MNSKTVGYDRCSQGKTLNGFNGVLSVRGGALPDTNSAPQKQTGIVKYGRLTTVFASARAAFTLIELLVVTSQHCRCFLTQTVFASTKTFSLFLTLRRPAGYGG